MQSRWEVARCINAWLGDTDTLLTDDDCDRMLRFLQDILRYAAGDMPIAVFKAKAEKLSQRDSAL
jgi:HEPN domain-containing protein